jgi:hypothetical protein
MRIYPADPVRPVLVVAVLFFRIHHDSWQSFQRITKISTAAALTLARQIGVARPRRSGRLSERSIHVPLIFLFGYTSMAAIRTQAARFVIQGLARTGNGEL